jgi:hypothetical protein
MLALELLRYKLCSFSDADLCSLWNFLNGSLHHRL